MNENNYFQNLKKVPCDSLYVTDCSSCQGEEVLHYAELIKSRYGNDINDKASSMLKRLYWENMIMKRALKMISLAEETEGETVVCDFDTLVGIASHVIKQVNE